MSAQISSRRFRKLLPRFETRVDAGERRDRLVKQLENGSRQERRVRRQLKRCRKASPCQLPMCPLCVRRLRRSFVKAGLICIDGVRDKCRPKDVPITAFSAVLTEEQYPAGDLVSADLQRTNERLQRRHLRCGFPLVF